MSAAVNAQPPRGPVYDAARACAHPSTMPHVRRRQTRARLLGLNRECKEKAWGGLALSS
jgi:hypothetical protein